MLCPIPFYMDQLDELRLKRAQERQWEYTESNEEEKISWTNKLYTNVDCFNCITFVHLLMTIIYVCGRNIHTLMYLFFTV